MLNNKEMLKKAGPSLRDHASWFPLAWSLREERSRILGPIFSAIPVQKTTAEAGSRLEQERGIWFEM